MHITIKLTKKELNDLQADLMGLMQDLPAIAENPVHRMFFHDQLATMVLQLLTRRAGWKPGKAEIKINWKPASCYVIYELLKSQPMERFRNENLVYRLLAVIDQKAPVGMEIREVGRAGIIESYKQITDRNDVSRT